MHFTFGVRSRRLGPDNFLVGWVIKDDTTRHTNVHVNVIFTFSELHYLRLYAYFGARVFPPDYFYHHACSWAERAHARVCSYRPVYLWLHFVLQCMYLVTVCACTALCGLCISGLFSALDPGWFGCRMISCCVALCFVFINFGLEN